MWEIDNLLQVINFLRSLCFGVILCLIYDILRAFRKHLDFTVSVIFFQDITFSMLVALMTFIFLLSITNGELRGFVFVSIAIGFFLSRFTISRVWIWLLEIIIGALKSLFSWLLSVFYASFDKAEEKITIFFQKSVKDLKKLLKNTRKLLYTKQDRKV